MLVAALDRLRRDRLECTGTGVGLYEARCKWSGFFSGAGGGSLVGSLVAYRLDLLVQEGLGFPL
jgi:hypothetical protein